MNKVHTRTAATIILLSLCLSGAGCTTTRTLPVPRTAQAAQLSKIKPGDNVSVTLQSGETRTFRVTSVESDALVGKNVRITYAETEKISVKKVSILKTGGVVLGAAVVALAGLFAYYVDHDHSD